jgi:hypothetical protein
MENEDHISGSTFFKWKMENGKWKMKTKFHILHYSFIKTRIENEESIFHSPFSILHLLIVVPLHTQFAQVHTEMQTSFIEHLLDLA